MSHHQDERRTRALHALEGLSLGDALGERFFGPAPQALQRIRDRWLPEPSWTWTDDTQMALSIVETLFEVGRIDPDLLATHFAERYEPHRGYGGGAHDLLQALRRGLDWRELAPAMFGGSGSYGNGSAMRVAPVGAFFADDLDAAVENAARSARVTHAHPEGEAGAIAVAVAAAMAWRAGERGDLDAAPLFAEVLRRTPDGMTREALARAAGIDAATPSEEVAARLGSGQQVSCQDTVPFAIWCAAHHLGDFEETFWATVAGLGDRDTTCAISCGIAAMACPELPDEWLLAREALGLDFL